LRLGGNAWWDLDLAAAEPASTDEYQVLIVS
jgi:hypothetical protein